MAKVIVRQKRSLRYKKNTQIYTYIYIFAIDTVSSHEFVPSLENHDEIQSCGEACDESVWYD